MANKSDCTVVRILASLMILAAVGFAVPHAAGAKDTITLNIAAGHTLGTDWVKFTSEWFCPEVEKRVAARTKYSMVLKQHWAGSLAKVDEVLESTKIGLVDIGCISTPFEPAKLLLHNYAYYIPFYTDDPVLAGRINVKLYEEVPALKKEFEKYNQVYLGSGGVAGYGLITNFPVHKGADVKGYKICGAGPNLPWITGVGGVGVQGVFNEAYTGLQTGVYDGYIAFPTVIVSLKLQEVSKYFCETGFGALSNVHIITANKQVLEKLPKDVRAILQEVAGEFSEKYSAYLAKKYDESIKKMAEAGVKIYKLPQAEKVDWAKNIVNLPKKFATDADAKGWPGTTLMKGALKHLEEAGHKNPRNWME